MPSDMPPRQPLPPTSILTIPYDDLYDLLGIENSRYLINDLEILSKMASSLSEIALGRGRWLIETDRFRLWIQTRFSKSDLVLVNGYLDDVIETNVSPLTILCASLVRAVWSQVQLITLAHFCGLHGKSGEWSSGPKGMLRCLIAQLLLASGARGTDIASFPGLSGQLLQDLALQDLGALWVLFQELLRQVPLGVTVFIILDGISTFETSLNGWDNELCQIVFELQQLVIADPRSIPVLKVLLVAPIRSINVFWQVDSENHISLTSDNVSVRSMHQLELARDIASSMVLNAP
jgi:hypothetical protein